MNKRSLIVIILGVFLSLNVFSQEKTMKVISYNVYWGMKKDSTENKSKFAEWIKAQNPDVIALQEMNGFTQQALQKLAASYGHPYAIIVKEPAPDGSISFPVAITSKYPIVNVQRVVDNILHGLIVAEIEGYHFLVTHFHPFSSEARGHEIDLVLANKKAASDKKWLLMGDLNSVSPLDKDAYSNNLLRDFIREDKKKRPHNENLKDGELDYTVQQKVLDAGFIDPLKKFHPSFIPTAPTKVFYDQSSHPLRYDYLYVSKNMESDIVSCEAIKDNFTDTYSDHYPIVLITKIK